LRNDFAESAMILFAMPMEHPTACSSRKPTLRLSPVAYLNVH
jgi:hypothetical protein